MKMNAGGVGTGISEDSLEGEMNKTPTPCPSLVGQVLRENTGDHLKEIEESP